MLSVLIVGAGPTGMALALLLRQAGIACEICDARAAGAAAGAERPLALSETSRHILARVGVWDALQATPVRAIHVSQQGHFGRTLISAAELGLAALGHVTTTARLAAALAQACEAAGLRIRWGTRVLGAAADGGCIHLCCRSGSDESGISARLVAWAEGGSTEHAGLLRHDYRQQALVAEVQARPRPAGIAYERFTPLGPAALLPLEDRYALVWAMPATATELSSLDDGRLLARLDEMFGGRLGFTAVHCRSLHPLFLRCRITPVGRRAVWVGNAAQTLHPIAAQGFNLALRDVAELTRLLVDAADCGDAALLARYAAARRADRLGTIAFTDALVRLFGLPGALPARLRASGLLALDLVAPVRRLLARRLTYGAPAGATPWHR